MKILSAFGSDREHRRLRGATFHVLLASMFISSAAFAAEPVFTVGFLPGGTQEHEFWASMSRFAEAVAEDLNVDLQITYPRPGEFATDGHKLLNTLNEDAYFVTMYIDAMTPGLPHNAEARQVRSFLINSDILDKDRERIGKPRERLRHWIGHMRPDDVQAGYRLADILFKRFEGPEAINMIAINGDDHSQSDADRQAGLKKRLSESPGARLIAVQQGDWSEENAHKVAKELLSKHAAVNAIWAASDPMALGALAAAKQAGKQPGEDIVIAGVDWTSRGLEAVQSGDMLASVGGHFMEAGIALLLIYDYHHGRDFTDDPKVSFKTSMIPISRDEIDRYVEKIGRNPDWSRIDFKLFTKTHNPDLNRYDFSWRKISEQL